MKTMTQQNQKGFTLIELMIVIAIIGILAAIALPQYQTYTKKARFSEVVLATSSVKGLVDVCFQTRGAGKIENCKTAAAVGADLTGAAAAKNVASVTITGDAVVTGKGTTDVDEETFILTPTAVGGTLTWLQEGTCVTKGLC